MALPADGLSAKIIKHMQQHPTAWRTAPLSRALGEEADKVSKYLLNLHTQGYLSRCEVIDPNKDRREWEYRIAAGKAIHFRPLKSDGLSHRQAETHGARIV